MTVVLKFGSGILTREQGSELDEDRMGRLVEAIAEVHGRGFRFVLVSSGAVAAGMQPLGLAKRPSIDSELPLLQACAAVGQSLLMNRYEKLFARHDLLVAQMLLSSNDFQKPDHRKNFQNTLGELLKHERLVPIINENDSVAVQELRFSDNDALASDLACCLGADRLILLTAVDGLLDGQGRVIPRVDDIEEARRWVTADAGPLSVGGMGSKLEACQRATSHGIPTLIANGDSVEQLSEWVQGRGMGTHFLVDPERVCESSIPS